MHRKSGTLFVYLICYGTFWRIAYSINSNICLSRPDAFWLNTGTGNWFWFAKTWIYINLCHKKAKHKLQMFWARILPICVECKYIPGDSTICYTCLYIYSLVNMPHIFLTEAYVCNFCRSSSPTQLINRFQVTLIFQLQISNSNQQHLWHLRIGKKTLILSSS